MSEPRDPNDPSLDPDDPNEPQVSDADHGVGTETASESADVSDASASAESVVEPEPQSESEPEPTPAAPAKPKWSILGGLALLIALIALGGTGYLYYRALYDNPLDAVAARVAEVSTSQANQSASTRGELDAVADGLREELAAAERRRSESEQALMQSLNDAITTAPPTEEKWKIAEVEYLLRIANHRAVMERDAATALQLLSTADVILTEIDDFALHPVRAALADEMLALKSRGASDAQGLFLRIEALKSRLASLPLRAPEYFAPEPVEDSAAQTPWQQVVSQLSSYFKFRRLSGDEAARPLLSPDEGQYLEMNLRLMFERAQLALLRQDDLVFESSVADANDWVARYLDPEDPSVQAVRGELAVLLDVDLDAEMPDISSSLRTLQQFRGAER